jgi:hypothetical protein
MSDVRCPGQDMRFWKPKDIFELRCPHCGHVVEFWKDDPKRTCGGCGKSVINPRLDLSCAKWCQYADACLGALPQTVVADAPVIERLAALLEQSFPEQVSRMKYAREVSQLAEKLMQQEGGHPLLVKSAAMLTGAAIIKENDRSRSFALHSTSSYNTAFWKRLLNQAEIETALADGICRIVEAVVSGTPYDSPEYSIVWDALQIELLVLQQINAVDSTNMIKVLKTPTGKQLVDGIMRNA